MPYLPLMILPPGDTASPVSKLIPEVGPVENNISPAVKSNSASLFVAEFSILAFTYSLISFTISTEAVYEKFQPPQSSVEPK